ncbi:hypothetical protein SLEP1_g12856 [Rubroshorea leprosula]|uniref:Uncharacterized protein n=1 Tax=Rubroshorea leprosula TaxID=152421 RepID=A0AAV5IJM8_9ROSI|nr:hypothetical protein SLEP1_g12856 [Rubroshorea leprosula]
MIRSKPQSRTKQQNKLRFLHKVQVTWRRSRKKKKKRKKTQVTWIDVYHGKTYMS